jgi:drug/metabolite transporter (DMT)-like permease
MISFFLCLILALAILVLFRLFERFGINNLQAIIISYAVSALAAFLSSRGGSQFSSIMSQPWFYYSFIIGTSFFIGFNLFALSSQKAGLALTSVAANISVVIPVSLAFLLYGDQLNGWQIAGLILAFVAILLVFKPKDNSRFRMSIMMFPLALFIINGINNSLMKQAEFLGAMFHPMLFLGMIFSTAFAVGLLFLLFIRNKNSIQIKNLLAGILLGLLNFGSTYYFLNSLNLFQSSIFFPLFNLSFISLAAIIGVFVFKEKLRPVNWAGIIIAIFAIAFITYFQS